MRISYNRLWKMLIDKNMKKVISKIRLVSVLRQLQNLAMEIILQQMFL